MEQKDQNDSEHSHSSSALSHAEIPGGKNINRSRPSNSQYIKGMIKSQPAIITGAVLIAYGLICFMEKSKFATYSILKRRITIRRSVVGAACLCAAAGCTALAYKIGTDELKHKEN